MLAILSKMKVEKAVMKPELLQSHCRVYVGLCRWRGDYQTARAFAYSLLKEGECIRIVILFQLSTNNAQILSMMQQHVCLSFKSNHFIIDI